MLCDMRSEYADGRLIEGVDVACGEYDEIGKTADVSGACLTMTHDHGLDQDVIEWALRRGFAFVGGVAAERRPSAPRSGSRTKIFQRLIARACACR